MGVVTQRKCGDGDVYESRRVEGDITARGQGIGINVGRLGHLQGCNISEEGYQSTKRTQVRGNFYLLSKTWS